MGILHAAYGKLTHVHHEFLLTIYLFRTWSILCPARVDSVLSAPPMVVLLLGFTGNLTPKQLDFVLGFQVAITRR